jgi:hypothetical protein
MNYKRILILISLLSLITIAFGNFSSNSRYFEICLESEPACFHITHQLGEPLFASSFVLLFVSTVLLAVPLSVFRKWLWFGGWYIPLGAVILIFYQGPGGGMNFNPYVEQMTFYVTSIFIWVSLAIIFLSIVRNSIKK